MGLAFGFAFALGFVSVVGGAAVATAAVAATLGATAGSATAFAAGAAGAGLASILGVKLKIASFCPKYIDMATKPPTIRRENKTGGLWSSKMAKSTIKMLPRKGWSSKAAWNFFIVSIQLFILSALNLMVD